MGWPPVRSFRKNIMSGQKPTTGDAVEGKDKTSGSSGATSSASACPATAYVKVSMDGAPYLRKIDLKLYKTYQDLSNALSKMFSSFTIGKTTTTKKYIILYISTKDITIFIYYTLSIYFYFKFLQATMDHKE